jgi:hypothetical protein
LHLPNTLPDPWTMVIKPFDTIIADGAVRAPRRPVQHTSVAILNLDNDAINGYILGRWRCWQACPHAQLAA